MPHNFQFRPDRRSAPILASGLVLFLGAIAATVVALSSGHNPYFALAVFAGLAILLPIMGFLLRATPERTLNSLYSWIRGTKSTAVEDYQPKAKRASKQFGDNRPPTAAELKDLRSGTNNWVPSNVAPRRKNGRESG